MSWAEPKVDMTPLIDVTFLLLIFLLCLDFKNLEGELAVHLPSDGDKARSQATPVEDLDVRIGLAEFGTEVPDKSDRRRHDLVGHQVFYDLGPKRLRTMGELESELRKAAMVEVADPTTGRKKKRPITITAAAGICYQDVTEVIDIANDAGFQRITYGGGEGSLRRPSGK
ncbi:MAG TPA: biopolymer transporter ExbD [Planctomycetota bacterium]|nr:biopolymer transporter ExbD [Planctomycetota bacterium]